MNLNKCKPDKKEYWLLVDGSASYCVQRSVLELAKGLQQFAMPVRVILLSRLSEEPFLEKQLIQFGLTYSYLNDLYYLTGNNATSSQWRKLFIVHQHFYPKVVHSHDSKANLLSKSVKIAIKIQLSCRQKALSSTEKSMKLICNLYPKAFKKAENIDLIDRFFPIFANSNLSSSFAHINKSPSSSASYNDFLMSHSFKKSNGHDIAFIYNDSNCWKSEIDFAKQNSPSNCQQTHALTNEPEQLNWKSIGLIVIHIHNHTDVLLALEAMARQIPVIAIENTLAKKLIKHNKCGWVTTKNNVNSCITQWYQLSENDRELMQKEAKHNIAQHFSSLKVIPQIISVYQNC